MTSDLSHAVCEPCQGGIAALEPSEAKEMLKQLHDDWVYDSASGSLTRNLTFKGFAKPVYHANLAAFLADQQGHHPDVAFGWGYCRITFTTHEVGGLTANDFICAAKFDATIAAG